MVPSKKKNTLLNTPMNKLGLGGALNNWFSYYGREKQDEVLTLGEFIKLNSDLKTQSETFRVWKNEDGLLYKLQKIGFEKDSISWKKIYDFLINNGFAYKDWIQLLPNIQTPRGMCPNFALLDKKTLMTIPVHKIVDIKRSCNPYKRIQSYMEKWDEVLTVSDLLLGLSTEQVEYLAKHGDTENAMGRIQKKLKDYGFTAKDGDLMKSKLLPEDRTTINYVKDLQNEGYAKKEAEFIVNIAVQKKWFQK